ncbi:MAG: hypothetical protein FJ038_01665 [Chloroflexi bacterium]|nr:hypothetical protein [Chloroflexota bacterium]
MLTRRLAASTLLAGIIALGVASPIAARDTDTIVRGACSGPSDYKLKVGPEGRLLEVEFEVDANRVGQTWGVLITDNDRTVFRGSAVTEAPSGSFTVRARTPNQVGRDVFVAYARNTATGEICRTTLTV